MAERIARAALPARGHIVVLNGTSSAGKTSIAKALQARAAPTNSARSATWRCRPDRIGVVDAKGEPIALERRRIDREESTFTLTVDRRPAKAGIDPLNKLIDRKPDDNTVSVTIADR